MNFPPLKTILLAQASACLAGAAVGAVEASFKQYPLVYSMVLYGFFSGWLGWLLGLVFQRHTIFYTWIATWICHTLVVGRFILYRDIFQENPQWQQMAWTFALALAILLLGLSFSLRTFWKATSSWALPYGLSPWNHHLLMWMWPLNCLALTLWPIESVQWQSVTTTTPPASRDATGPQQGVIWFVADTLRADSLATYQKLYPPTEKWSHQATGHLDAFAQNSHVFEQCYAQASWTKPSMASILTSTYVHQHQTMSKHAVLPKDIPTIGTVLQQHNICTLGIMNNVNLSPVFGFQQGFEHYLYLPPHRLLHAPSTATGLVLYNAYRMLREKMYWGVDTAEHYYAPGHQVNQYVVDGIKRCAGRDFFVFAHYMEAHDPYFSQDERTSYARVRMPHPPLEMAKAMQSAYQQEIIRIDTIFASLRQQLQSYEQQQPAEIHWFFFADHGEEFAEHGGFYHGTSLYNELIHVPLLIQSSKIPVGQTQTLVQTIDIAPTTLSLFNLAAPSSFQGQSLHHHTSLSSIQAQEDHQGHRLETAIFKHAQGDAIKGIMANADNPRGLPEQVWFNLTLDPWEQSPLAENDRFVVDWHKQRSNLPLHTQQTGHSQELETIPESTIESLRSLGYIQ